MQLSVQPAASVHNYIDIVFGFDMFAKQFPNVLT